METKPEWRFRELQRLRIAIRARLREVAGAFPIGRRAPVVLRRLGVVPGLQRAVPPAAHPWRRPCRRVLQLVQVLPQPRRVAMLQHPVGPQGSLVT